MNEGVFWSSYTESVKFLKDLDILKENNTHKRVSYSPGCAEYSRGTDYKELYQNLVDNRDYDLLLKDDSMFQMSISGGESRMMFIQNPLYYISFDIFLDSIGFEPRPEMMEQLRSLFYEDYRQALEGMKLNSGATYFRYDVDARGRKEKENIHSYTHLHVGLNNKIRIPVGLYLTPLAFTKFVVRHVYYDIWATGIGNGRITAGHKETCGPLPKELWTESERHFLHLA